MTAPVVLMYHRIGERGSDPWSLTVSPERFRDQLIAMRERGPALPLAELVRSASSGAPPAGAFAVTFDDGYADALHTAAPVLEELGVPATFFVPAGCIGRTTEWWWDELEGLVLSPGRLSVPPDAPLGSADLWRRAERVDWAEMRRAVGWTVGEQPPNSRHQLYVDLWKDLRARTAAGIESTMGVLRSIIGHGPVNRPSHRTLSVDEFLALAAGELFEVGGHTLDHPSLGSLGIDAQRQEIAQGNERLMMLTGRAVTTFAYPFGGPGDRTPDTPGLLTEAGVTVACTTSAAALRPDTDPMLVPRVNVNDVGADALLGHLGDAPRRRARHHSAPPMAVCTIVARNYLAHARVLAESVHRIAGRPLKVLVTDAEAGGLSEDEPFELLTPTELPLERTVLHEMAAIYDAKELATALKPTLLTHLLDWGAPAVVYLDPDILLFEPIDEAATLAREHGIVLTPHSTRPLPRDGATPTDDDHLRSGSFNLGFVAVGPESYRFLDWWAARLRYDCVIDMPQGLYVDQRWVDLVPGYFRHHVIRSPAWNVAYWNGHDRSLTVRDGRLLAGDEPVRFFHFSGFDPTRPDRLTTHDYGATLRIGAEHPALQALTADYADRLLAAGYEATRTTPYGFDVAYDGTPLEAGLRRRLRDRARSSRSLVPDPFDADDAIEFGALLAAESAEARASVERMLPSGGATPAGWIDVPADGERVSGPDLAIVGWGVSAEGPFAAVEAAMDGRVLARTALRHERPDIEAAFPRVPGARLSGFRLTVPAADVPDGRRLAITLVADDGSRIPLGTAALDRATVPGR